MIVSAAKWAINVCVREGADVRVKDLYQSASGDMSMVIVFGSFLAAKAGPVNGLL